jgi:hypothetical protein
MFRVKSEKPMETPVLEREVLERLRELADASSSRLPSPDVETRLLQAFADAHRPHRALATGQLRWLPAIAASAMLATVVALLVLQTRGLPPRHDAAPAEVVSGTTPGPLDGFVPIPGAASLPLLESASIVRYELPVSTLPRYGVDIMPDAPRRTVEADLLIGQDGYARAIRLVTGSMP